MDASSSSERKVSKKKIKRVDDSKISFVRSQTKEKSRRKRTKAESTLARIPSLPPSVPPWFPFAASESPPARHKEQKKKAVTNESTFPMYYTPQRKANATKTNPRRVAFLGTWASFSLVYLLWETINTTQPNARLINSFCCM